MSENNISNYHIICKESQLSTTNSKDSKVSRQNRGKNANKKKGAVNKMNL